MWPVNVGDGAGFGVVTMGISLGGRQYNIPVTYGVHNAGRLKASGMFDVGGASVGAGGGIGGKVTKIEQDVDTEGKLPPDGWTGTP